MKKFFLLILLTFSLIGCSSNKASINSDLYKDGEEIIQAIEESIQNEDTSVPREVTLKFKNFARNYSIEDEKVTDEKEIKFVDTIGVALLSYDLYTTTLDDEDINSYYAAVNKLESEYGIKVE